MLGNDGGLIDEVLPILDTIAKHDVILSGGAESSLTELSNDELLALVSLDLKSAVEA